MGYVGGYVLLLPRLCHLDEDVDVSEVCALVGVTVQRQHFPLFHIQPERGFVR